MLSVDVRCRIDPKTKQLASAAIESMGLSVSDAIRLFLTRVAADGAIPFELRVPNAVTIAAMEELNDPVRRAKLKTYSSVETLIESLKS